MVEDRLRSLVDTVSDRGVCHVLEIGAGHGTFTDVLLRAGADVTVSEVSEASAVHLGRRYADEVRVEVVHDPTGTAVLDSDVRYDAVVMISVLHHIPDYLDFVRRVTRLVPPGGGFLSVQDPIWYARRSPTAHLASRGTYFIWRLGQGELRRGLATRWRRLRGRYDDSQPSDLVEYHVVRQGVDERGVVDVLAEEFHDVELFEYWSTQPRWGQRWGDRAGWTSDFGVLATARSR